MTRREKIAAIDKVLSGYRKIAIYHVFANLADGTRWIYLAWVYLTLAVILSIPFLLIEVWLIPVSRYERRLRKQERAEHLRKVEQKRKGGA